MSVMTIEMTEINTYRNQFVNSNNLFEATQNNEFYKKAAQHYVFDYYPKKDKKEVFIDMIDTMLWYLHCANITAYNLQYKENVAFEHGYEFDDKMKADKNSGNYNSLLYNICTNAGTVMMQNSFKEIAYFIKDEIKKGVFNNDKPLIEKIKTNPARIHTGLLLHM